MTESLQMSGGFEYITPPLVWTLLLWCNFVSQSPPESLAPNQRICWHQQKHWTVFRCCCFYPSCIWSRTSCFHPVLLLFIGSLVLCAHFSLGGFVFLFKIKVMWPVKPSVGDHVSFSSCVVNVNNGPKYDCRWSSLDFVISSPQCCVAQRLVLYDLKVWR